MGLFKGYSWQTLHHELIELWNHFCMTAVFTRLTLTCSDVSDGRAHSSYTKKLLQMQSSSAYQGLKFFQNILSKDRKNTNIHRRFEKSMIHTIGLNSNNCHFYRKFRILEHSCWLHCKDDDSSVYLSLQYMPALLPLNESLHALPRLTSTAKTVLSQYNKEKVDNNRENYSTLLTLLLSGTQCTRCFTNSFSDPIQVAYSHRTFPSLTELCTNSFRSPK